MRSSLTALAALFAYTSAHGVITEIQGANGVKMPGLSVIDGTPRDCATPLCGSEADTSIIRNRELGTSKASALGRTQGGGPVDASAAIAAFMGGASNKKRGLLATLAGTGNGGNGGGQGGADAEGQKTAKGTTEQGVSKAAGTGASSGLPTASDDGTITLTYHQVNQDGAGPLSASIDPTSLGADPSAFVTSQVIQDVPGLGIGGLSAASTMDFQVKVQMPEGMTCTGQSNGVSGICVVRVQNSALAGPFGGSAAFVQAGAAQRRAVELKLRKRHFARALF
ncbi:hypothetical protein GQ43DRAFT_420014 [Delitschia confertaspora ATCC 74209]|uniref:Uncharacterized protein n=1 Tax=Delitschia confertaspora ATCC 74209 TaxID=1513339 RepID=A0A9P4JHL1_9PLEO|nr:hypothetical protein GQ43DRAFT_420014 [Delitschia confertaspora ATCC 74209]